MFRFTFVSVFLLLLLPISSQAQASTADTVSTLTVLFKESPPFVFRNEQQELEGISVKLWEQIAAEQGWQFEYQEVENLQELLDSVAVGAVDISINPLTVTSERVERIRFTQPFFNSNLAVVVKVRQTSVIWGLVKRLFSFDFLKAVLLLFGIILLFGLFVWIFERRHNAEEFGTGLHGIWQGIWWSAVTMTTVGYGDKSPKTVGGRIVALIWMFAAIIMISSFTASIASSLTVDQISTGISSANDLRELNVGTIANSSSEEFFSRNLMPFEPYGNLGEGLDALYQGQLDAFVYDEPILQYELLQNKQYSDLQVLPYNFNNQYYSFATAPDSTLADEMNPVLLRIIEDVNWKGVLMEYNLSDY